MSEKVGHRLLPYCGPHCSEAHSRVILLRKENVDSVGLPRESIHSLNVFYSIHNTDVDENRCYYLQYRCGLKQMLPFMLIKYKGKVAFGDKKEGG